MKIKILEKVLSDNILEAVTGLRWFFQLPELQPPEEEETEKFKYVAFGYPLLHLWPSTQVPRNGEDISTVTPNVGGGLWLHTR